MNALIYLMALVLALPVAAFAAAIKVLDHVIAVRNPFKLFLDFLLAFGWGVPAVALALLVLVIAGFFRHGQLVGAAVIFGGNLAALFVILRSEAAPKDLSETIFLMPAVLSAALMAYVAWSYFQPNSALTAAPVPARVESGLESR
jgi:hypothetical protein